MAEEVNYLSPYEFTHWACEQVRDGCGFVPFIGSGVSAKSGILMGVEFTEYLAWTVYRCVASPAQKAVRRRLDLRQDGWPMHPRPDEVRMAKKWIWDLFETACDDCGLKPRCAVSDEYCVAGIESVRDGASRASLPFETAMRRPLIPDVLRCEETDVDDSTIRTFFRTLEHEEYLNTYRGDPGTSPTSPRYIEECAVRSLHDWRSTLDFLARLKCHRDDHLCIDDSADQAVVDSFNLHITRGKRPNLAHGMICHLANRARIRTVLTTNFDTLLEDAFAQLGEAYAVFPVSLNGKLPPPDSVHAQNCIVKLHGGLAETRANHSLDDPPSDEDKRRFFHYVRGCYPGESPGEGGFLPSHLLVCGYSGSDMRCVQMIKYLLDSDKEAQVFWICHSPKDVKKLYKLFAKERYRIASDLKSLCEQRGAPPEDRDRLIVTVSPRTDLLLYEFYQRLALALPRGGLSFPLSHNVPPEESFSTDATEEQLGNEARDVTDKVLKNRCRSRLIVADGKSGLTAPLRQAFHQLTRHEKLCGIWLELDAYADVWSLAHALFEQIALQLGRFQLDHARFVPKWEFAGRGNNREEPDSGSIDEREVEQWRRHIERLLTCWNIDPPNWLIVLNGRNGPGTGAGWGRKSWSRGVYLRVGALVKALLMVKRPHERAGVINETGADRDIGGFNVLYAPYSETRRKRDRRNEQSVENYIESCVCSDVEPGKQECKGGAVASSSTRETSGRLRKSWRVTGEKEISCDSIVSLIGDSVEQAWNGKCLDFKGAFARHVGDVAKSWLEPSGCPDSLERLRQRRFLYAITLFRHARHLSSFLSDGVFPSPHEFSISDQSSNVSVINVGIDNDWRRFAEVNGWLDLLNGKHKILLCTPGGHAWMHRDARNALWHIAEELPHWDVERLDASPHSCATYPSALNTRSRTHFLIGQWYLRGFCTSGHAAPLLEALYHFKECVRYAPYAKLDAHGRPPGINGRDEAEHKCRLAKHALFEMSKSLHLARSTVEYWIQPTAGDAWFSKDAVETLMRELRMALKIVNEGAVATETPFSWEEWIVLLSGELQRLPNLDPERNRWPMTIRRDNPTDERGSALSEVAYEFDRRLSAQQIEGFRPEQDFQSRLIDFLGSTYITASAETKLLLKRFSRSFLRSIEKPHTLRETLRKRRNEFIKSFSTCEGALALARTLCELAPLYVHSARSLELVYGFEHKDTNPAAFPWFSSKSSEQWLRVFSFCRMAQELCFDADPRFAVADFRVRIHALTLSGLALGHLGRFFEAQRYLNDAHALLTKVEGAVKQPDVAPIHLRSAEVNIVEAHVLRRFAALLSPEFVDEKNRGGYLNLGKLKNAVEKRGGGESGYPGTMALEKVQHYFNNHLADLLARMKADKTEVWLTRTIEFLQSNGRREFFQALAATLLSASVSEGSRKSEVSPVAIKAAVFAAAQYFHVYLGHLVPAVENRTGERRNVFWRRCRRSLLRQHYAKLDDAWMSLEAAEQGLSGRSHRSWWWGKLYCLQLLVYSEHAFLSDPAERDALHTDGSEIPRTLAFRTKRDFIRRIERIYCGARAASPLTLYSSLTAIHHAARSVFRFFEACPDGCEADRVRSFLKFLREELNEEQVSPHGNGASPTNAAQNGAGHAKEFTGKESAIEVLAAYRGKVKNYLSRILRDIKVRERASRPD